MANGNMKDIKHFPWKEVMDSTAPGVVQPKDAMESTPNAGTTSRGKDNSGEHFKYRFGSHAVIDAACDEGAKKRCQDVQEGTNLSQMEQAHPPAGNAEEDASQVNPGKASSAFKNEAPYKSH